MKETCDLLVHASNLYCFIKGIAIMYWDFYFFLKIKEGRLICLFSLHYNCQNVMTFEYVKGLPFIRFIAALSALYKCADDSLVRFGHLIVYIPDQQTRYALS